MAKKLSGGRLTRPFRCFKAMGVVDVFEYINKFRDFSRVGVEDFADKFNAIYSVAVLIICCTLISVKQYFMDPLACYTGASISGSNIESYLNNYCWVEGTYNIHGTEIPNANEDWNKKSLADKTLVYYQWVPFVLALQCVLFIIPRFIWQILTYNRTGTDLENLVKMASEATTACPEKQQKKVQHIASTIKNMIFATRDVRCGRISNIRRKLHNCVALSVISKRMGTWVTGIYLFIKIAYLCNNVGQIYLIQRFLGIDKRYDYFGFELARDIANGKDWRQTNVFPRVTFCRVPIQNLGAVNYQVSQCVLSINFLNEKVYIFLWFWLVMGSFLTVFSIPIWLLRILGARSRTYFVKKNLLLTNRYKRPDKELVQSFMNDFLRHDGLFILRMMALNAGDLITSEVVASLWDTYSKDETLRHRDMSNDRCLGNDRQMAMKQGLSSSPKSKSEEASNAEVIV